MRLGFITSNDGKLHELQTHLAPFGFEVTRVPVEYPEIQVESIEEVARFGLNWIIDHRTELAQKHEGFGVLDFLMLEDSGIFVHALNDFPGVYSKFVFKTVGYHSIIELLTSKVDRSAHFESCIALIRFTRGTDPTAGGEKPEIHLFKGTCSGTISDEPRGEHGFGYDPIFIPTGENKTFAEMEIDEKNRLSHRGAAMAQLVEFLRSVGV
jgi:XTP/dITP diphosphohydrolase